MVILRPSGNVGQAGHRARLERGARVLFIEICRQQHSEQRRRLVFNVLPEVAAEVALLHVTKILQQVKEGTAEALLRLRKKIPFGKYSYKE